MNLYFQPAPPGYPYLPLDRFIEFSAGKDFYAVYDEGRTGLVSKSVNLM